MMNGKMRRGFIQRFEKGREEDDDCGPTISFGQSTAWVSLWLTCALRIDDVAVTFSFWVGAFLKFVADASNRDRWSFRVVSICR
ncbi:hypothetical protein L484_015038 [Morus notabilis]|uniref:Uncharacterized protein n=1 Tax=Morus notabilis TaxID=981085 RepID=W9SHN4_9ROSA|nr:hypothetical protein L484_015038 [Morus notabilis]